MIVDNVAAFIARDNWALKGELLDPTMSASKVCQEFLRQWEAAPDKLGRCAVTGNVPAQALRDRVGEFFRVRGGAKALAADRPALHKMACTAAATGIVPVPTEDGHDENGSSSDRSVDDDDDDDDDDDGSRAGGEVPMEL